MICKILHWGNFSASSGVLFLMEFKRRYSHMIVAFPWPFLLKIDLELLIAHTLYFWVSEKIIRRYSLPIGTIENFFLLRSNKSNYEVIKIISVKNATWHYWRLPNSNRQQTEVLYRGSLWHVEILFFFIMLMDVTLGNADIIIKRNWDT